MIIGLLRRAKGHRNTSFLNPFLCMIDSIVFAARSALLKPQRSNEAVQGFALYIYVIYYYYYLE